MNPIVYWLARAVFQPFFHIYFRLSRIGREHIPPSGPVIFAANHRSFLDPFMIGTLVRRPIYYVAKKELFTHRVVALVPQLARRLPGRPRRRRRGHAQDRPRDPRPRRLRRDLPRGHPHAARPARPPKRGVGRLALETGAPVVPVAVIGTENVRRGWRIRPHKVRIRVGRPLTFPRVEAPSPQLARPSPSGSGPA